MKALLLITGQYPLNSGDSFFINSEMPYLTQRFDRIHILTGRKKSHKNYLAVPEKVVVHYCNLFFMMFMPVYIVKMFFESMIYYEIKSIIKTKKQSLTSFFMMIGYYVLAQYYKKNAEVIIKNDDSIQLLYSYWFGFRTLAILLIKEKYHIKCITRAHRHDLYEYVVPKSYQPFKIVMDKRLDKIYFISNHGYNYYMNIFARGNKKKYNVAKLGTQNHYPVKIIPQNTNDVFKLISCSSLVPVKRIDLIIDAISLIDTFNLTWIHLGDGLLFEKTKEYAKNVLSKKENVSYQMKGFMSNDEVMKYYYEQDIDSFISTSESEGLPVSMMEAISFGIPIIGLNVGGVSEIVSNKTGILLEANATANDIKDAIIKLHDLSGNEKLRIRTNARALWEAEYNAELNHFNFANDIISIIASGE